MDNKKDNVSISDLTRIRKLILAVVKVLEDSINDFSKINTISDQNKELIDFLFGKKSDIVSIITKLTNALIKVIPLEEKTLNTVENQKEKIDEEDIELLKRYINKCNFWFNKKEEK